MTPTGMQLCSETDAMPSWYKKGAARAPFSLSHDLAVLDRNYVLSLGTFLAIRYVELNFLAIGQSLEAIALDGAEMNEHIGAICTLDKAETLGFVKPFNCTCCLRHNVYLYSSGAMSRHLFIEIVIYGLRTDDLDGTSTVSINTAETTQQFECSTIIGNSQRPSATIFLLVIPG
jgi:hypothetical protein